MNPIAIPDSPANEHRRPVAHFRNTDTPRGSRHGRRWSTLAALALLLLASGHASAIPAFARQTGSSCADCHAAAYGPALTAFGMRFKLNGYTDTDSNGTKIPAAVQLIATHAVPARGEATSDLSEADLYLAGRVNDHIGGYVKVENDNDGHGTFDTRLNNVDLRYVVQDLKLAGKHVTVGVSVNNNPGFEDPIGALPDASGLGPPSVSGTLLNQSALSDRVIGTTVYALYDSDWYGEIGTYRSLPTSVQDRLGYAVAGDPGRLADTGYFRFAYMKDLKHQFFSAGLVALTTKRQLPRTAPADDITDLGYDLTYQFIGNRQNIVQLSYVDIHEHRRYGSVPASTATPGLLALKDGSVRDRTLAATYVFRQSYGVTVAHLTSTGSRDAVRFPPSGVPDTTSNLVSVFWTPWGKDDSLTSMANFKVAATWFRFTRFNGSSSNVFGAGPGVPVTDAGDLNEFTLTVGFAF